MTDRVSSIMSQLDREVNEVPGRPGLKAQHMDEAQSRAQDRAPSIQKSVWRSVAAGQLFLNDLINQQQAITNLYDSHIQATRSFLAQTERFLNEVQNTMRSSNG